MVIYREDTSLPVVKIVSKKNPDTFMIINEMDFKPGVDVLWEDRLKAAEAEKLAMEEKAKAEKEQEEARIAEAKAAAEAAKATAKTKAQPQTQPQTLKETQTIPGPVGSGNNSAGAVEQTYADQAGIQK